MSEQIDAIYDHGVLWPLAPLALPDKARVKVTIDTATAREPAGKAESEQEADQGSEMTGDFDRELETLLFDGPSLPPDFSRADIYADHD